MSGSLVPFPNDKKTFVVDSWPVMEWLKGRQPATAIFRKRLEDAQLGGEVYYNCIYLWQQRRADEILAAVRALPIEILHPSEEEAIRAARIKGLYRGAYGDAFAAVLAVNLIAPVVTGDPDFLKLQTAGVLVVEWLGK